MAQNLNFCAIFCFDCSDVCGEKRTLAVFCVFLVDFSGSNKILTIMGEVSSLPHNFRHLRACLLCSLVKSFDQFEDDGCENCETYLGLQGNRSMIYDCTSTSFEGIIGLMAPHESWVAKWKKISRNHPGLYALDVSGRLPEGIVNGLKERGVYYSNRSH